MHRKTLANLNSPVSRAEYKLYGAVDAFHYDFRGKIVLDIGSSTGGFTELALKRGARQVIAVEKGTKQMKSPLRLDPRIELHEKTDIFDCNRENLHFSDYFETQNNQKSAKTAKNMPSLEKRHLDVILADVSFVSLRKILLHAKYNLANLDTDFLVMLKPQFEANPSELKRGVVKNEAIRRKICKDFEIWSKSQGFIIVKKRDNDFPGRNGNLERFYYLTLAKKY